MLLALLWFTFALNYLDRQMVYSIFPALSKDLGFSAVQLGLVGSVFMWVYTLSMPVAGRLADLWRRDRMILASLALWSVATLGCGLSGSTGTFLGWRAMMGLTESLYYPAALALLSGVYAEGARSRVLGIHQSAQLAGVVAGGWFGGWAADHVGWRTGFLIAGGVGIVWVAVLQRALPVSRPAATAGSGTGGLTPLVASRCFVALAAAFSAFCAILWIFYAWFPSFLYERYHLSMTDSGWNATLFVQVTSGIGVLIGSLLADRLARRWPAARLYIAAAGLLGCAPFAYLAFAADSLVLARLWAAGFGLFGGLMIGNAFAAAFEVVPAQARGFGAGVLNTTGGLSSSAMIYLTGYWKESVGISGVMQWAAAVGVAAALVLVAITASRFGIEKRA